MCAATACCAALISLSRTDALYWGAVHLLFLQGNAQRRRFAAAQFGFAA